MLNISIVLDLANDYSVNAGVFRDSGNFVKEYANLCSATALYLLALQSEQLDRDQRQELISKCESFIKLQEEIEQTRFSTEESSTVSQKKKRKKKTAETTSSGDVDPGFQQQQLLQHAAIISSNIDDKEVILAAQDTHDHYYSESDDSVDFSPTRKAKAPNKKKASPKKQMKIKIEPKSANTSMIDTQFVDIKQDIELVQVVQDPVVVNAPDHFGYCELQTPNAEVTEGFYNFTAEQLKAFSERFKGKSYSNSKMTSRYQKSGKIQELETDQFFAQCKNFLCPVENYIREWFPTEIHARLRAKALDPWGLLKVKNRSTATELDMEFVCQDENCHARLRLRKVNPDPDGNTYGLYGCFSHQHSLFIQNKSELVFQNRTEANDFYEKHLKLNYRKQVVRNDKYSKSQAEPICVYSCRRRYIKKGNCFCKSTFSISPTFYYCKIPLKDEDKPYSIQGVFYHTHRNESQFNRNADGSHWKKTHPDKQSRNMKKRKKVAIVPKSEIL